MNATIHLGDATISRVVEWAGPVRTVAEILPDTPAREWQAHRDLLVPDFWDPASNAYLCHVQTWVIRVAGCTVLVDTGVGNDRDRPQIPQFANLQTDFLDRLAAAGVEPGDVDIVINTHIHYDHVGWNTRLIGGAFVPTFPNATYLVPRADYEYFHPANAANMRPAETEDEKRRFDGIRLVFNDSIAPVEASGQLQLWQDHRELPGLPISLEPAPGHTPGSSLARLNAGPGALFVGDLLHSPMQILHADHCCSFDLDAAQARGTRRRILAQAAAVGVGTKHIVKQLQWAANTNSSVRFLRYHAAVEKKIRDSGVAYTFLRPNLFMQGLVGFRETIVKQGKFFAAIGDAKISAVDVRDIAAVAAAALTEAGHEGKTWNITGPEALTHQEMAEKLSDALGHRVQFEDVPPQAMREAIIDAGFPQWQVDGLIEDYAHYARGEASEVMTGVEDATGKSPRSFDQFARDYASAFA